MADETTQQQAAPSVDTAQLSQALDALTRVAAQTVQQPLNKSDGVQIAHSGTTIDGKPGGGGITSETGGIDDLMIGKMSAAGFDAGVISDFRAFMEDKKKKAAAGGIGTPPMPPFGKSETQPQAHEPGKLAKSLTDDPEIQEAVDASPFMEALVARTTGAIDTLEKSMHSIAVLSTERELVSARALLEVGKIVKSQARVINELGARLGIMERAPVTPPKGRTGTNGAQPLNKSGADESARMTKSEVLSTLGYMNLEKGIKQVAGQRTIDVIGLYEGGNVISDAALGEVRGFLTANPHDAPKARAYT